VLKLEDGTNAYSVIYGQPIWPDRTIMPLRAFGWHRERDAAGQPTLTSVDLLVTVQTQFELGLGDVQTVIAVAVIGQEVAFPGSAHRESCASQDAPP
jgi:hypothetical protein